MLTQLPAALEHKETAIAVIGLGYVGLPLATALAERYEVIGFDISPERIAELKTGRDRSGEVSASALQAVRGQMLLTGDENDLARASVYIVTVPTPIDRARRPDLGPLLAASASVGRHLQPGNVVIYESTVYPGCTQEQCQPVLERESALRAAFDSEPPTDSHEHFFLGYSPERINPGDRQRRLSDIIKVTSGSTPQAAAFIDQLYAGIVSAGTHRAPSIQVAEAAKVIENTQRDVNIALINELAMLFNRLGLDTTAVLEAAATKWNFLPFKPGLVGGHCIGVDPYYLTHKAQEVGFHPKMILAGRRTNDAMGQYVAGEMLRLMAARSLYAPGARVLVMGLTFKENCPDLRNTRVIDVVRELERYNLQVDVHDPLALPERALEEHGLSLLETPREGHYQGLMLCVAHDHFKTLGSAQMRRWLSPGGVIYDLKRVLPAGEADAAL